MCFPVLFFRFEKKSRRKKLNIKIKMYKFFFGIRSRVFRCATFLIYVAQPNKPRFRSLLPSCIYFFRCLFSNH